MNKARFLTLILVCLFGGSVQAQLFWRSDYKRADSVTLNAYLNQDWATVIAVGNKALKHNVDYYYLRMRMGIAYYETNRLPQAANQYEKALFFNEKDPTAQTYLYGVYQLLGKNQKAYQLSKQFNKATASTIAGKIKFLETLNTGAGVSFSNNFSLNSNLYLPGEDSIFGQQVLYGDKQFWFAGLQLNLSPVTSLYFGYTHLLIDKKTRVQYYETSLKMLTEYDVYGFQRTFSQEKQLFENTYENQLLQNEFYLKLRFQFENSWSGALFANMLTVKTDLIETDVEINTVTDTSSYNRITGDVEFMSADYLTFQVTRKDTSFVNYLYGFRLEKDYNTMTFGFSGVFSSLNGLRQSQLGLSAFYYIGYGTDFYGSTEVSWFIQQWPGGNENRGMFRQSLGHRLYRQSWLEADFSVGNQSNASSVDAMLVYNQADKTNYRIGLSLMVIPWANLEFNLRYQYVSFDGYITYDLEEYENDKTSTFAYQIQNVIGGITWKF